MKRLSFAYGWSRSFGLTVRRRPDVTTIIFHCVPIHLRPIRWGGIGLFIKSCLARFNDRPVTNRPEYVVGDDYAQPLPFKLTAGSLDEHGFTKGGSFKLTKAQLKSIEKSRK